MNRHDNAHNMKSIDHVLGDDFCFAMEAHNALSARIAVSAGFKILWASGLTISTAMGFRDLNEMSWSQLVDTVRLMAMSVAEPIIVDGDSGYGDFNNARTLLKHLENAGAAGVCLEDKEFPKRNSFLRDHQLADISEFCGKIKACKETRARSDFLLIARTEALIAGAGMDEAVRRAHAFVAAGADSIFVHSKRSDPEEILEFCRRWDGSAPVFIAPTTYGNTPPDAFRAAGVRCVIWANHNLRASISAMQDTCAQLRAMAHTSCVDPRVSTLQTVFSLLDYDEYDRATGLYSSGVVPRSTDAGLR